MSLLKLDTLDNMPTADYLEDLQAYNLNEGVDRLLDTYREIIGSEQYYPLLVPFPTGNDWTIAAGSQFQGSIRIPIGSILTSITGAQVGNAPNDMGFKLRVYDRGTKSDLIDKQVILGSLMAPELLANVAGEPFGPNLIMDPGIVILDPGSLQVSITNLDETNSANIQVLFAFAVPIATVATTVDVPVSGS